MPPRLSLLFTLGVLAACGSAGAETARGAAPDSLPEAPAARIEAATVAPSDAALVLQLPGEVAGGRDALLAAANGGYVESVLVQKGDRVSAGQALVRVNTRIARAQRDQAAAQAALAEGELARVEALGDMASRAQLDALRTQVVVAKAQLEMADVQVARSVVTAPFAGTVADLQAEVGEVVGPGTPIARLVQLDTVKVNISVSDRDVGNLAVGAPVQVSTDASPAPLPGQISAINPAADLSTRSFLVEATVPNDEHRLLPGMIARVAAEGRAVTGQIVLPQDWLVTRRDGVGVFVVQDGVSRWRPVRTGPLIQDQVVITEGLADGELVVMTGQRALADGDAVLITRQGRCCTNGRPTF